MIPLTPEEITAELEVCRKAQPADNIIGTDWHGSWPVLRIRDLPGTTSDELLESAMQWAALLEHARTGYERALVQLQRQRQRQQEKIDGIKEIAEQLSDATVALEESYGERRRRLVGQILKLCGGSDG